MTTLEPVGADNWILKPFGVRPIPDVTKFTTFETVETTTITVALLLTTERLASLVIRNE